ncbi:hypothetical protein MsAg5_12240 [Methanosarcinaceae archaeon Ag5]|uniref:Uncharacterized protein n=1 Tax=Methanolapillus africanus TaxID=3028297 RepID=A0AAE4SE18_9EURY|nr:hypothetical protein [Methanosarcinaceae archaeon Ag5]
MTFLSIIIGFALLLIGFVAIPKKYYNQYPKGSFSETIAIVVYIFCFLILYILLIFLFDYLKIEYGFIFSGLIAFSITYISFRYIPNLNNKNPKIEYSDLYLLQSKKNAGNGCKFYGTQFKITQIKQGLPYIEVQVSDLIIDFRKMEGKNIAQTCNNEFILSKNAVETLKQSDLSGIEYRPVHHRKDRKDEYKDTKYFQLTSSNILPPISKKTKFRTNKVLGYIFLFLENYKIYYDKKILEKSVDFN